MRWLGCDDDRTAEQSHAIVRYAAGHPPPRERALIVDLFAGAGGVDEGIRLLDIEEPTVGIEWNESACRTAIAAGHPRIRADISKLPTSMFAGAKGVHVSPPCQCWAQCGTRKGELDRANCHCLADRMAAGDDSTEWTAWEDERSPLVCQPVRWVRDLRPEWVTLEEVPQVAPLWDHFARIFSGWGYSVWTGDMNAVDYGLPQNRIRRILIASRVRKVQPPEPTHAEVGHGPDLFGNAGRAEWVTMAESLGWPRGAIVNTRGVRKGPGGNDFSADRPSWALTSKVRSWKTTARPGPDPSGGTMTIEEAARLQSFRPGYPWFGSTTARFLQIGNAVPPLMAAHFVSAASGASFRRNVDMTEASVA